MRREYVHLFDLLAGLFNLDKSWSPVAIMHIEN